VAVGTAIGHRHLRRFPTVVADSLKLEVKRAHGEPSLRALEVLYG